MKPAPAPDPLPTGASTPSADRCICPLCGAQNGCAIEAGRRSGLPQRPCWCAGIAIDPAQLERVAVPLRHVACICRACAWPTV